VPAITVTLTPSPRPVGGILAAARPLPDGWWRGVTFSSTQCVPPLSAQYCPDTPEVKTTERTSDVSTFDPFGLVAALECSTIGRPDIAAQAAETLDVVREWLVGRELAQGLTAGNADLADATGLGAATSIVDALATLEEEIADSLYGRLGFIHASPAVGVELMAADVIYLDGVRWRTVTGNVVVISPGYAGLATLNATGEVWAAVGQRETFDDVDRAVDTAHAFAEEAGVVAFDPCFNVSVTLPT
jgi:hypothetical protein